MRGGWRRLDLLEWSCLVALFLVSLVFLRVDFAHRSYRGDGAFRDTLGGGHWGRYEVDFGPVDLTRTGTRTFRFSGLPREEFVVGFGVTPTADRVRGDHLVSPRVRLRLIRDGQVVIDQRASIGDWTWSLVGAAEVHVGPSFVYRPGLTRDVPTGRGGEVRIERVGVAADEGWGTYFQARPSAGYELTVEVLSGDPVAAKFEVRVRMKDV